MDNIEVLKQMKAELMQRIDALDSAISVLEQIHTDEDQLKIEEAPEPKMHKGKVGKMQYESEIDLTKIPDYNPRGGGIRTDT